MFAVLFVFLPTLLLVCALLLNNGSLTGCWLTQWCRARGVSPRLNRFGSCCYPLRSILHKIVEREREREKEKKNIAGKAFQLLSFPRGHLSSTHRSWIYYRNGRLYAANKNNVFPCSSNFFFWKLEWPDSTSRSFGNVTLYLNFCRAGFLGADQSRVVHVQPRATPVTYQHRAVSAALRPQFETTSHWQERG